LISIQANRTVAPPGARELGGDSNQWWARVLCLTVMPFPGSPGVAFAQTRGVPCRTINVAVALSASGPHNQRIQGTLCGAPGDGDRPVQILVHGFTLTRAYWDFPVNNDRYSYVNAAVAQGYSTLAIDRIGVGESSTPAAVDVTLDSNVQTVHDVVRALRDGSVTGSPVHRVVLVGHSFGSAISVTEAGRFHDVDAVVKDTDPRVLAFDEAHKGREPKARSRPSAPI
jgi:hypothetical protein